MLEQPARVPQRHLAQTGIAVAGEQGLAVLPQALVAVHAAAVVREQRLGHEGHGLPVLVGHIADDVLVQHQVVRHLEERGEPHVDLGLAARGDFVMVALGVNAALDHGLHHLAAQILVVIGRRNREVPFLVARPVAEVVLLAATVPTALVGVDEVVAGVLVLIEPDVVEDEELGFGPEKACVREAGVLQVQLGLLGDPARVALVMLARDRVDCVGDHDQRRRLAERIHDGSGRVGNEQHVAFVDGRPRTNAGAVEAVAFLEDLLVQFADRIRNVMPETGDVAKAQVDLLGVVFLGKC